MNDDAEEEDRSQDLGPHFVRACALEMHFNISQEPLYTETYRENAAPQKLGPNFARACHFLRKLKGKMPQAKPADHTLRERAQSKCTSTCHKSHSTLWKFTGKMPQTKPADHTLCEPARSKCMSTFHKSHFIQKFTGKMLETRVSTLIKHRPLHLP